MLFFISKRVFRKHSWFKSISWLVTVCNTCHMLHQSTVKIGPNKKVEMWVSHPTSTFFQHFIFSILYLKDFIILFSTNKEKGVWKIGTAFCHLLFKYGLSLFLGLLRNVLKFGWSLHQIILALVLSFFHYLS